MSKDYTNSISSKCAVGNDWAVLRSEVAADETTPVAANDFYGENWAYALVDVQVSGGGTWDVTPVYYNDASGIYHVGTTITVSGNERLIIPVYNTTRFNVIIDNNSSGVKFNAWIKGLERTG